MQPLEHDPKVLPELTQIPLPYAHHDQKYFVSVGYREATATIAPVKSERRICRLRRNIFIGLILCIVLLIAVVGGVVGGVLAMRSKQVRRNATVVYGEGLTC